MAITAECESCKKKFKANDKLTGKRVKCPQCGGVIAVPVPLNAGSVSADPAPEPKPKPAQQPKAAPAAAGKCPSCSAEIATAAVLCVNCGLDLRTGKPVEFKKAAAADASRGKKKKRKKKRGDTPQAVMFLRGCAVSLGFALVGSCAWWAVAYFWEIEFGIIAWALGGLAGAGMSLGYDIEDLLSGLAAAAIAFFAIFVAKVLVIIAILSHDPLLQAEFPDPEFEAASEAEFQAEEPSDANALSDDQTAGEEGAEGDVAGDDESGEGVAKQLAEKERPDEYAEPLEDSEIPDVAMGALISVAAIIAGFVWMFWPPLNILFLLLACATAYQVGSGGSWAD